MKEKKVSQSATKIRIISCTAAPCAPFRPRCAHSRPLLRSLLSPRGALLPAAPHPHAFSARPFGQGRCEKPAAFRLFLPTFRKSSLVLEKSPHVFLPSSPTGSPPPPRRRAKISHRRGESAQKCARVHFFFIFCLLSMRGKHAIFASKTCFINSAWQKRGRSSPFLVCPPEYPDTSLPSL